MDRRELLKHSLLAVGAGFTGTDPTVFRGPTRHGLDQIELGLQWAPMNQRRDDTKPRLDFGRN